MTVQGESNAFYQTAGKGQMYTQEAPVQTDKRLMESYYPETAAVVQVYVEDACDRLDYEGSFIYDEYPDKGEMERVCQAICQKIEKERTGKPEECRAASAKDGALWELTTALFCQELHCRRCRRNRCRRFF